MTPYIRTSLLVLTLYACNNTNNQTKNRETISNDHLLKELSDSKKTTEQLLNKITPSVLAFEKADTSNLYYGNMVVQADTCELYYSDAVIKDNIRCRLLLVGKVINKTTILAMEINIKDTVVNFYMLDKHAWKLIGSEKTNIPIYNVEFEDLDGDHTCEIITSTRGNINGSTWQEVYYFSEKAKTIHYAGSFSSSYVVLKDKKQVEETYEGSWYMDRSKTLYEWQQEKLVPLKKIILANKKPVAERGKLDFEYYENSVHGLKLKFREPYSEDNKKQQQLWNNFFNGH